MITRVFLALLFACSAWVLQVLIKGLTGPLRKIPGPWYTRFTNLPLKWATMKGRRNYFIDDLHRHYGDVVRIAPGEIAFNNPELFREVHRHGRGFRKAGWYRKFTGYMEANDEDCALFAMLDPRPHGQRRKVYARAFSKTEIRKHWEDEIREKIELAVERMSDDAGADARGEVDVMKWWVLMASDVSSKITFGESFDNLHVGKKNDYIVALEANAKAAGISAEMPILKYIPLPALRKLFSAQQSTLDWAAKTVDNSRKTGSAGVGNIFTSIFAEAEKEGGGSCNLSDMVLTREARSFIIAGSDTTAVTLTFLVWCVLARPQLHAAMLDELRQEKESCGGVDARFASDRLEQLPLLNAIIHETLRLYGAAPGSLPRKTPPGGATVGGMYIPDTAVLSTQSWSLHRHPGIWDRPDEFDATRWLKEGGMSDEAKAAYNPFGGGARVCIGQHIAEMELRCAVATFFWRYPKARLAPTTTDESMRPVYFFIINPQAHECRVLLS
ncbi:Cytochrome P450 [Lasiodiplodia theobromae]|nr:Cytochrome P450 [Lasiodiplodia theobromae]